MKLRIDVEDVLALIDKELDWYALNPYIRDEYHHGVRSGLATAKDIIEKMANITDEEVETILDENNV